MKGKIIFNGQLRDGEQFVIRYPQEGDALAMVEYINTLSKEQTFILFQGEQITHDYEINYLRETLKKIEAKDVIHLSIWLGSEIIGISTLEMKNRAEGHKGDFGISIAKKYRGHGLGKLLMGQALKEAISIIPQLQIITLSVFSINTAAIALYKGFGFKAYGLLPEGLYYKHQYVDQIYMYKKVK